MTGGTIGWIFLIMAGVSLLFVAFHKKSYEKAVELYGPERADRRYKIMRYIAYIGLPLSVAGLIWDILTWIQIRNRVIYEKAALVKLRIFPSGLVWFSSPLLTVLPPIKRYFILNSFPFFPRSDPCPVIYSLGEMEVYRKGRTTQSDLRSYRTMPPTGLSESVCFLHLRRRKQLRLKWGTLLNMLNNRVRNFDISKCVND